MEHTLPQLPYSYDALEPYIDAQTMEIHHTKHHQAYITNLNKALESHTNLQETSLEELLMNLDTVPEDIRTTVQNNGGGHYNHSLFWKIMTPDYQEPSAEMTQMLDDNFSSLENFKTMFADAATKRFGSGWAWLVKNGTKLEIMSTPNQDSPIMQGKRPVLGLDVWEHAYYLNYQNKRNAYIEAWWNVVNWVEVEDLCNRK